jgi:hypothetical protein
MKQCTRCTPQGITGFWDIAGIDQEKLEDNFNKILSLKSSKCEVPTSLITEISRYSFQYIGVYIGSEKYIYINAFIARDTRDKWKTEPVDACDGGKGFWGALFNLDSQEFSQLQFNSEG